MDQIQKMKELLLLHEKYYDQKTKRFSLQDALRVFLCTIDMMLFVCRSHNEEIYFDDGKYYIIQNGAESEEIDRVLSMGGKVGFSRNHPVNRSHVFPILNYVIVNLNYDSDDYDVKFRIKESPAMESGTDDTYQLKLFTAPSHLTYIGECDDEGETEEVDNGSDSDDDYYYQYESEESSDDESDDDHDWSSEYYYDIPPYTGGNNNNTHVDLDDVADDNYYYETPVPSFTINRNERFSG